MYGAGNQIRRQDAAWGSAGRGRRPTWQVGSLLPRQVAYARIGLPSAATCLPIWFPLPVHANLPLCLSP
jgi:hypothetical protein